MPALPAAVVAGSIIKGVAISVVTSATHLGIKQPERLLSYFGGASVRQDHIKPNDRFETPGLAALEDVAAAAASDPEFAQYRADIIAQDQINLRQVRENAERAAIMQALQFCNYNMAQASRLLGVTRPTLYNLTDKYKIDTSSEASET